MKALITGNLLSIAVFICDGKISVIRFFYKKGIPLKFDKIKIGDNEFDDLIDFGTLDYFFILNGVVDVLKNFDFKKGDVFEFKQFSRENFTKDGTPYNFDSYRNSVEKIQIFL